MAVIPVTKQTRGTVPELRSVLLCFALPVTRETVTQFTARIAREIMISYYFSKDLICIDESFEG